ncbi:MAG: hypothetical protein ACMUIP_15150 [bacterium]
MIKNKLVILLVALCIMGLFISKHASAQYGLYGNLFGNGLPGVAYGFGGFGGLYGIAPINPLNPVLAPLAAPAASALGAPNRVGALVLPTVAPALTATTVAPPPVPVVIVTTNWVGGWYILNTSASVGPQTGVMTLQLTQNTLTGQLDGLVDFGATNIVPVPVSVTGILLPGATTFDLDGIYFDPLVGKPANINLVCTLTSSTTMSGTLTIISWKGINFGDFYLTLI